MSTTLTNEQKDYIIKYLDEMNGGTFNEDVNTLVAPNYDNDSKEFNSSADVLIYFTNMGIAAVENGLLTYNQLLGREPLNK